MDRINSRIAQVYGYAVCFITVIVMLISIKQVVDALIDLSDPIRAEGGGYGRMGRPIANFEVYKMAVRREPNPRGTVPAPVSAAQSRPAADTVSDAELRRMYDAEREDAIGSAKFRATRSLVGNLLLIILAGVLFGIHWRWLKQRDAIPTTP
jgi:hypothetical protein